MTAAPAPPAGNAATLGEMLRSARESKGLSLEDAESAIRIRARQLAALETDDYTLFISPTQVRGFIKLYAGYLGLDPEQAAARYGKAAQGKALLGFTPPPPKPKVVPLPPSQFKPPPEADRTTLPDNAATGARPATRSAEASASAGEPLTRRTTTSDRPAAPAGRIKTPPNPTPSVKTRDPRLAWMDMLIAAMVTAMLVLLLLWGGAQLAASTVVPTATRPPLSGLIATVTPAGTPTASPIPPSPSPTLDLTPAPVYAGVNVLVRAEQRLWLRVLVDGVESFAGLLRPGESREFIGQNTVEIVTGNGRGTRVVWNGEDQGTLGELGEVVTRLWTTTGVVFPTPTVTPTPPPTVTTAP